MGFNFSAAGYSTVSSFVSDCCASEAAQLQAFDSFLQHTGIAAAMQAHDWTSAALKYNGPGQVAVYADRLQTNFNNLQNPSQLPDISVRAAQLYLSFLSSSGSNSSYDPGGIDGQLGTPGRSKTLQALNAFQTDQGLATTNTVDDEVLMSLAAALPAPGNLLLG